MRGDAKGDGVPEIVRFESTDGSTMLVEVDDDAFGVERVARRRGGGVIEAGERLEEVLARARSTIGAVVDSVRSFAPDEYEIEFGLKLNAEAGAVVARTAVEGHFTIKLVWRRDGAERAEHAQRTEHAQRSEPAEQGERPEQGER